MAWSAFRVMLTLRAVSADGEPVAGKRSVPDSAALSVARSALRAARVVADLDSVQLQQAAVEESSALDFGGARERRAGGGVANDHAVVDRDRLRARCEHGAALREGFAAGSRSDGVAGDSGAADRRDAGIEDFDSARVQEDARRAHPREAVVGDRAVRECERAVVFDPASEGDQVTVDARRPHAVLADCRVGDRDVRRGVSADLDAATLSDSAAVVVGRDGGAVVDGVPQHGAVVDRHRASAAGEDPSAGCEAAVRRHDVDGVAADDDIMQRERGTTFVEDSTPVGIARDCRAGFVVRDEHAFQRHRAEVVDAASARPREREREAARDGSTPELPDCPRRRCPKW